MARALHHRRRLWCVHRLLPLSALLWEPVFGVPIEVDGYLSPFFSPLIRPDWLPLWFSPAILVLWAPLGFRVTCYYYRKAYYRAYFADPPACGVGEPKVHRRYALETVFPFILQNSHRYFLYAAFIPLFLLHLLIAAGLTQQERSESSACTGIR